MKALALSVMLHAIILVAYYEFRYLNNEGEGPTAKVRIVRYSELGASSFFDKRRTNTCCRHPGYCR
jgi:hypothetical protein